MAIFGIIDGRRRKWPASASPGEDSRGGGGRRAPIGKRELVPNKPMVPTAPASPAANPLHPMLWHIGQSLGGE